MKRKRKPCSAETKEKIRQSRLGYKWAAEQYLNFSKARLGLKYNIKKKNDK